MNKVRVNYREESAVRELADMMVKYMTNDIVLVNIGTDRCIGDAVGPMVGTFLKEANFPYPVYGTIKEPVHALNIERRLNEIKAKHPNAFVIATDACLGDAECIGEVQCRDYPIHPGKGVGKCLPDAGDISLVAIVDSTDNNELFTNRTIRLDLVMDMARVISNAIILAEKEYRERNQEAAVSGF